MIETDPRIAPNPWRVPRPALEFAALALALLLAISLLAQTMFGAVLVPLALFALISGLCLRGLIYSYPNEVLGACNVVTLVRTAMVSLLAGAIFAPVSPWVVFGVAVVAFALDGVDGWLARRAGLSSVFGARFDMEADALLGAILALVLLSHGTVGPAILVLGFSRYIFVIAGFIWPALRGDLPESYRRKAICVIQVAALILLVCPLTPAWALPVIATGAAAALLYSFAVDAIDLLRRGS